MRVINQNKLSGKENALSDIDIHISTIQRETHEIKELIDMVDSVLGGSVSGIDLEITDQLRAANEMVNNAIEMLYISRSAVSAVDIYEEVPDENYV